MPRSGDGSYTLPSGFPAVSGTSISSTVHNATMADVANELTSSLDRAGKGGMTGPLKLPNGTLAAPGLAFTSNPDTGLFGNPSFIGVSVDGVQSQTWGSAGISTFSRGLQIGDARAGSLGSLEISAPSAGTGPALRVVGTGVSKPALEVGPGNMKMVGTPFVSANNFSAKQMIQAWGIVTAGGTGSVAANNAHALAASFPNSTTLRLTFTGLAMASADYLPLFSGMAGNSAFFAVSSRTTTHVDFVCQEVGGFNTSVDNKVFTLFAAIVGVGA